MKRISISTKQVFIPAIAILLVSLFLIAGCAKSSNSSSPKTSTTPPPASPGLIPGSAALLNAAAVTTSIVTGITATQDASNSLIFHIEGTVNSPGLVTVQYWSDGNGPFITAPVNSVGSTFSTEVMRLRASTLYNYKVFLSSPSNPSALQYQGTFTTGPLPQGLQNARINDTSGTPTWSLLLLDYNCTNFSGIVAIDNDGQIVWYYQNDHDVFTLAQEESHNIVFEELGLNVGYRMREIAPDGMILHSVDDILDDGTVSSPRGRWNHEMLLRPGNKVWTIGADIRTVNINGKDTLQNAGTIEEWDIQKGTVTRLANLFNLLDPVSDRRPDSDTTGGFFWMGANNQYSGQVEDWTHSNSLAVLPNGDILMSNRHLDQLVAIKPDFSGVDWKLGGEGSDFTFPYPKDEFYHQHYARMLPDGNILLFDNGNLRPDAQGGQYSRGEELKLDFSTMSASKVWEYRNTPDLFSSAVGSIQRLNNGHTVIDFGVDSTKDNPGIFTVVEAGPDGSPLAITTISSPGKGDQYRAIPADSLNGETESSVLPGL